MSGRVHLSGYSILLRFYATALTESGQRRRGRVAGSRITSPIRGPPLVKKKLIAETATNSSTPEISKGHRFRKLFSKVAPQANDNKWGGQGGEKFGKLR
jgi:hypothetical protein